MIKPASNIHNKDKDWDFNKLCTNNNSSTATSTLQQTEGAAKW
ncbi:hypothetical protein [Nostoc sp. NMS4]|nr:hypothetical protein [Nostoc sp. NMS4]